MTKWGSLIIVLTAPLLSVIDVFIVNIAIPSIRTGLHASDAQVQLVIAGYLLGYASFLITGGRLGDHYGKKRVFLWGMALFTLTSCFCGLSVTSLQLNLVRFFQGISAALMVPQTLSYIQILFPEHKERTKAIGWFGITLGLASILGQFLGGFFSYYHFAIEGWRLIFFINLPIGIVAISSAARYLKETPADNSKKFDRPGVVLLTLALVSLIVPLIQGREYHWPAWSIVLLLLSAFLFYWFFRDQVKKEREGDSPLINIHLFRNKDFNIGLLAVLCLFCIHNSYLLVSTLFLQNGLQLNAFVTGNAFVVLGIAFMISSLLSIRLVVRFGKPVVQVGVLIMIFSFLFQLYFFTRSMPGYWQICCLLAVHGFGTGLVMPSLLNITLKSVPLQFAGAASGLYSTVQQSASALGVTLIGGLFFDVLGRSVSYDHYAIAFRYSAYAEIVILAMMSVLLAVLPNTVRVGGLALAE